MKQLMHFDALVEQINKILFKNMGIYEAVLETAHVFNHQIERPNLIILQGGIKSRVSFFILEKDWKLTIKELLIFGTQ